MSQAVTPYETVVADGKVRLVDMHGQDLLSEPLMMDDLIAAGGKTVTVTMASGETVDLRLEEEDDEEEENNNNQQHQPWTDAVGDWYEQDPAKGEQAAKQAAENIRGQPSSPLRRAGSQRSQFGSSTKQDSQPQGDQTDEERKVQQRVDLSVTLRQIAADNTKQAKDIATAAGLTQPPKFITKSLRCTAIAKSGESFRTFTPLPLTHHATAPLVKNGVQKIVAFGGTNGNSTENEIYELHAGQGTWRRVEGKGHVPLGCYSHSMVIVQPPTGKLADSASFGANGRMFVLGGVGLGGSVVSDKNLTEEAAQQRFNLLFPNGNGEKQMGKRRALSPAKGDLYQNQGTRPATARDTTLKNRSILQLLTDANTVTALKANNTMQHEMLGVLDHVYEFRFKTGQWRRVVSDVQIPLARQTTVLIEGLLYTFGGITDDMVVSDALLVLESDTYQTMVVPPTGDAATQPQPRYSHSAVAHGGLMLLFGGCDANNQAMDDVWAFDTERTAWSKMPCIGDVQAKCCHAAAVVQNRMIVVGGYNTLTDGPSELAGQTSTSIYELNLIPQGKDDKSRQCVWREVTCKPEIPRMSYPAMATFQSPTDASIVVFGGLMTKEVERSKKKLAATTSSVLSHKVGAASSHSAGNDSARSLGSSRRGHGGDRDALITAPSNKTFVMAFPTEQLAAELNAEAGDRELPDISPELKAFLKRVGEGEQKKVWDLDTEQKKMSLQAKEATECALFLKPNEIEELLDEADSCVNAVKSYDTADLQSNVADKGERVKLANDILADVQRCRDILRSMQPKKADEGPSTLAPGAKKRRRKEGEKITDFSAAKPFRKVEILDLMTTIINNCKRQIHLNKQLATFNWPEKKVWIDFCNDGIDAVRDLLKKMRKITECYIKERTDNLMKGAANHAIIMADLTKIVRKNQHDKIWNPDKGTESREKAKEERVNKARKEKERASGNRSGSKKKRYNKVTVDHKYVPPEKEPTVVNLTKEDVSGVKAQIVAAQKSLEELAKSCKPLFEKKVQVESTAAQPATTSSRPGEPSVVLAEGSAIPAPVAAPAQPAQEVDPTPAGLKDSEVYKAKIIIECNFLKGQMDELTTMLDFKGDDGKKLKDNELNENVLKFVKVCQTKCNEIVPMSEKCRVENPDKQETNRPYLLDESMKPRVVEVGTRLQGVFQLLKFVFLTRAGVFKTKTREKAPDASIKPPPAPTTKMPRQVRPPSATRPSSSSSVPATASASGVHAAPQQEAQPLATTAQKGIREIPQPIVIMPQAYTDPSGSANLDGTTRRLLPLTATGQLLGPLGQQFQYDVPVPVSPVTPQAAPAAPQPSSVAPVVSDSTVSPVPAPATVNAPTTDMPQPDQPTVGGVPTPPLALAVAAPTTPVPGVASPALPVVPSSKAASLDCVVLSGPAGVGKGTIIDMLQKETPDKYAFSVSHATRQPRDGEVNGVHYNFVSVEEFERMIAADEFVEYANVHANYYGTSKAALKKVSAAGRIAIVEIDVKGAKIFKERVLGQLKCCFFFINAPSLEELHNRMRKKGKDSEGSMKYRLATAKTELKFIKENPTIYDRVLTNDNLDATFTEVKELITFFSAPALTHPEATQPEAVAPAPTPTTVIVPAVVPATRPGDPVERNQRQLTQQQPKGLTSLAQIRLVMARVYGLGPSSRNPNRDKTGPLKMPPGLGGGIKGGTGGAAQRPPSLKPAPPSTAAHGSSGRVQPGLLNHAEDKKPAAATATSNGTPTAGASSNTVKDPIAAGASSSSAPGSPPLSSSLPQAVKSTSIIDWLPDPAAPKDNVVSPTIAEEPAMPPSKPPKVPIPPSPAPPPKVVAAPSAKSTPPPEGKSGSVPGAAPPLAAIGTVSTKPSVGLNNDDTSPLLSLLSPAPSSVETQPPTTTPSSIPSKPIPSPRSRAQTLATAPRGSLHSRPKSADSATGRTGHVAISAMDGSSRSVSSISQSPKGSTLTVAAQGQRRRSASRTEGLSKRSFFGEASAPTNLSSTERHADNSLSCTVRGGTRKKATTAAWNEVFTKQQSPTAATTSPLAASGSVRGFNQSTESANTAFDIHHGWLLFRVYVRVKMMVHRFKQRRGISATPQHKAGLVLSHHDTQHWLHVIVAKEVEFNDLPLGPSKIMISHSHLYCSVDSDSNKSVAAERASFSFRLCDIDTVTPSEEHWIDIEFCSVPNALIEGPETLNVLDMATLRVCSLQAVQLGVFVYDQKAKLLTQYVKTFATAVRTQELIKKLDIVHFNDAYHLPVFKPAGAKIVGGASRFHTKLSELRETCNPLVLFSGDFMGPSLMSVITKGKQMVDALNFLGVHYGCLGNHEFDFGLRQLKDVLHGYSQGKHVFPGSQTTWLMTNMTEGDGVTPLGNVHKTALFTWNGVRVGLLGLCEDWLPQCAYLHPHEAQYSDVFEVGESEAQRLKSEGAEIVIALSHCRLPVDRQITEYCPTIDYLLGGHDHFYRNEPRNRLVKSGQEFEYFTKLHVELFPGEAPKVKVECDLVTSDIPESPYMEGLINRYEAKMAEKLGKRIAKTDVSLDSTEETVRFMEGQLTNFVLDVMERESECDFAVLGAAAVAGKDVKPPGFVTIGDVFNWFPNETRIMQVRMKGSTVQKMLDVMVREVPAEAPSFPHPSNNLAFSINILKKPPVTEDIRIQGKPLDPETFYMVAVEEFVGNGKAKYKMVEKEGQVIVSSEDAPQLVNWVLDSFTKQKAAASSAKEARIKSVVKVVSASTHIDVDMDMAKSQKFLRSLVCELLNCDRAAVFMVDNVKNELHFFAEGKADEIRFPKHIGLAGHVACQQEIICIDDVYTDKRFNQSVDKSTGYRTKSMLAVPVVIDGTNCFAVVQAINKDPKLNDGNFDEADAVILTFLGEQLGNQMHNAAEYNKCKKEALWSSGDTDAAFNALKDLVSYVPNEIEAAQKKLTSAAVGVLQAEQARIIQRREEGSGDYFYLDDDYGDLQQCAVIDEEGTAFHRCITRHEAVLVENASKQSILSKENDIATLAWRNVLLVPLMTPMGTCVGAAMWINKKRGMFDEEDETLAKCFGQIVGTIVVNLIRILELDLDDERDVPLMPVPPIGRIQMKGGWHTIRRLVKSHQIDLLRKLAHGSPAENPLPGLPSAGGINSISSRGGEGAPLTNSPPQDLPPIGAEDKSMLRSKSMISKPSSLNVAGGAASIFSKILTRSRSRAQLHTEASTSLNVQPPTPSLRGGKKTPTKLPTETGERSMLVNDDGAPTLLSLL